MNSKLFDDSVPDRHSFHMQTIPQLRKEEQRILFNFATALKNQAYVLPKVPTPPKLPPQKEDLPCMLARNETSPPLHHAPSNACNKSFSVLSRDIGRTQRTALHRWRRWRLLSSVGAHQKSASSIPIQTQYFCTSKHTSKVAAEEPIS